jgi:hypothetical protein
MTLKRALLLVGSSMATLYSCANAFSIHATSNTAITGKPQQPQRKSFAFSNFEHAFSRIQNLDNPTAQPTLVLNAQSSQSSSSTDSKKSSGSSSEYWSLDELEDYAREEGVILTWSTMGPGFRSVARSTHNESKVLGYAEGFIRPTGKILHMDKMEMFQPVVDTCKKENPDFRGGGTILGVGLMFAYQCVLYGT